MGTKLQGKNAVVTGAGRGIGREIAIALAAEGAKVVVNGVTRTPEAGHELPPTEETVAAIKKAGGTAVANYDSVATMAGGQDIVKAATSNFGRIDILVNCAGNYVSMPALETTEEVWDLIIAVHLKGHFASCKAA